MNFLLMILLPWTIAAGCFVLRPNTRLGVYAVLATLAVEVIFLLALPSNEPVRSLGVALAVDLPSQVLIGALLLAVGSASVGWTALPVSENAPASLLVVLGLMIGAILLQSVVPASLLLLMAVAVGILLVIDTPLGSPTLLAPGAIAAAVRWLTLLMIGAVLLMIGYILTPLPPDDYWFSTVLMWIGLAIWATMIPFHVALASLAEDTTPYAFVCVVVPPQAVMLAVFERILRAQSLDTAGVTHIVLLVAAAITIVGAPLLARATVRRAMAFVLLANVGQIVLGMVLGVSAASGGMSLVAAHVLSATLICSSIALLEVHVPGQSSSAEPWRERPIAAAGLVIGLLMLIGVPGLGGFAPKLILWQSAWRDGVLAIAIVAIGTLFLALTAFRLARAMLFTPAERRNTERREQWRQRVAPTGTPASDIATLPVVISPYVPITLRSWTVLLIVIAVAMAIRT